MDKSVEFLSLNIYVLLAHVIFESPCFHFIQIKKMSQLSHSLGLVKFPGNRVVNYES